MFYFTKHDGQIKIYTIIFNINILQIQLKYQNNKYVIYYKHTDVTNIITILTHW